MQDWPFGRGTYISEDRRVSIWCNEEDHLRVTVLTPATTSLNEPFNLLNATLKALESVEGVEFKRSDEFGYVTSCPSNLGTGMRASVMVCLPLLTADETTDKASEIAKPFGLSVRGSGGEHTPVVGHMVDISPSARFGISEATILTRLFEGVKAMMEQENKLKEAVPA
jgi:protein-arginine kinase